MDRIEFRATLWAMTLAVALGGFVTGCGQSTAKVEQKQAQLPSDEQLRDRLDRARVHLRQPPFEHAGSGGLADRSRHSRLRPRLSDLSRRTTRRRRRLLAARRRAARLDAAKGDHGVDAVLDPGRRPGKATKTSGSAIYRSAACRSTSGSLSEARTIKFATS